MNKNFLDINQFNKKQVDEIINLAKKIKKNPKKYSSFCKDKTSALRVVFSFSNVVFL